MLPIIDFAYLTPLLKGLFLINPASILLTGAVVLLYFSLKTVTAKLAFVGAMLLTTAIITYCAHRNSKKENEKRVEKKQLDLSEDFIQVNNKVVLKEEEPELMLSRIFKK